MIHREIVPKPKHIYPPDEWRIVEKQFYEPFLEAAETVFSVSNGYIGIRGVPDGGRPAYHNGTFVNGFYESWPIVHAEEAYGFARTGQTIVNVPDTKVIKLYVDDEPFYLPTADLLNYERTLNMKEGSLDFEALWETPAGKKVQIKSKRIVSLTDKHMAAISFEVTMLNASAPIALSSQIVTNRSEETGGGDPRRARGFSESVLELHDGKTEGNRIVYGFMTKASKMRLACGIDHVLETSCNYESQVVTRGDFAKIVFTVNAEPGKPVHLTKYITYTTSRSVAPHELCARARRTLDRALKYGFEKIRTDQVAFMKEFWDGADILFRGNPSVQQALRWNLFQILQATGRAEGVGVPAKGLTGQGYEGHYFWDTEIYVMPFLIYTSPRRARNLLRFRYSMLDKARQRARELDQQGALFPWRTINGDECSAYYAAGTAQYHINADIMYAVKKYVDVTGDKEFLFDYGVEMLVETARMWFDLGFFSDRQDGKFCIHGVTGPDEYTTVVNNNTFTNLMARDNMWYAASAVEQIKEEAPEKFEALVYKTKLNLSEVTDWRKAADTMFIPFDQRLGIHPQDDDFLDKETWNFERTPKEKYPLLLHYHPLTIYRQQVIKQADVVLAMFLLGDEFSHEQKKRNFDYYDPLTTGDSSLSVSIQSIVAMECGYMEKAREYLVYGAWMDLADVHGNVRDGCHIASMGGTWMAVVYGLAGMRDHDGDISFDPRLPKSNAGVRFSLIVRGQTLEVDIDNEKGFITYSLIEGAELSFRHRDEEVVLKKGEAKKYRIETE